MIYRKAKISDVESIHRLVSLYAAENLMLARSRSSLYEGIREITVAEHRGKVVGCGSLHIIWEDLAEIRALAVAPDYVKRGIGRRLVNLFLQEARELELKRVFALTYQPEFFRRCGFQPIAKEDLPQKVWKECVNCPLFPNCNENAVIIEL
ncbi:N-acetyltransferase [Desulfofalx alkaliphila]|uniref:N-acetyltransferase n=1 Tax=Desulfofalx alkaliphila TaxID=105483 RepID=UPI0004E1E862|nr:N-acetyltransferase [Desulfofalx alkaliphila]